MVDDRVLQFGWETGEWIRHLCHGKRGKVGEIGRKGLHFIAHPSFIVKEPRGRPRIPVDRYRLLLVKVASRRIRSVPVAPRDLGAGLTRRRRRVPNQTRGCLAADDLEVDTANLDSSPRLGRNRGRENGADLLSDYDPTRQLWTRVISAVQRICFGRSLRSLARCSGI